MHEHSEAQRRDGAGRRLGSGNRRPYVRGSRRTARQQSCQGCRLGGEQVNGHLGGGGEAALIVFLMAAGILAVLRPDLYAGTARHLADLLAAPAR
ncbi:hypothetical protein [Streptomyces sp. NPDC058614]|uniref:hypothetical protein n=1 Tax=Streptomyces sp. NPDC058614 TaxID=3346557 RepID=UPI00365719EA